MASILPALLASDRKLHVCAATLMHQWSFAYKNQCDCVCGFVLIRFNNTGGSISPPCKAAASLCFERAESLALTLGFYQRFLCSIFLPHLQAFSGFVPFPVHLLHLPFSHQGLSFWLTTSACPSTGQDVHSSPVEKGTLSTLRIALHTNDIMRSTVLLDFGI